MMKVYEEYNLYPTCSIDFYDPNKQIVYADTNKPHTGDLFEFRNNLVVSEDKGNRELQRMIQEGDVDYATLMVLLLLIKFNIVQLLSRFYFGRKSTKDIYSIIASPYPPFVRIKLKWIPKKGGKGIH